MNTPQRRRLPNTRPSVIHKEICDGFELYIIVGFYDGPSNREACDPAEVFCKVANRGNDSHMYGSDTQGMFDALSLTLSIALQSGVPWSELRTKYMDLRFGNPYSNHPTLVHAYATGIDKAVEERIKIIGPDEQPPAPARLPKPDGDPDPTGVPSPAPDAPPSLPAAASVQETEAVGR